MLNDLLVVCVTAEVARRIADIDNRHVTYRRHELSANRASLPRHAYSRKLVWLRPLAGCSVPLMLVFHHLCPCAVYPPEKPTDPEALLVRLCANTIRNS
jgi:hypothetical protein